MQNPPNGEERIVPPGDRKTSEWITVLSALGIDYRLSRPREGWVIHVPAERAQAALAEIEAYEAEEMEAAAESAPVPTPPAALADSWSPWWVCAFVIAFYVRLGPYDGGSKILSRAAANTDAIFDGEWWRVVTALTVHSGPVHLAGNVVCLLLMGYALCGVFGGGLSWALILAAGIVGNILAALLHGPGHVSVGASTACFGALGILSAHRALQNQRRYGKPRGVWNRTWLPIGSGVALLTVLGTGPRSDLAAHAFGFLAGLGIAAPFSRCGGAGIPKWGQLALQLLCIAVVMSAWRAAFDGLT